MKRESYKLNSVYSFCISINFIFILSLSCSEPESLVLDNDWDSENPDYIPPQVNIIYTEPAIDDQGFIYDNNITLAWEGNAQDMQYRYRSNNSAWTPWDSVKIINLDFLDEGEFEFIVQGKYLSGAVVENPDTLNFKVNAVEGPALIFYPRREFVEQNEIVNFQILGEEVVNLMSAEISLSFDPSSLQVESINQGDFFQSGQESIFSYDINYNEGTIVILTSIINNDSPSVFGTGELFNIDFKLIQPTITEVTFINDCIFRDPDNNNINILEKINGLVVLE